MFFYETNKTCITVKKSGSDDADNCGVAHDTTVAVEGPACSEGKRKNRKRDTDDCGVAHETTVVAVEGSAF